MRRAGDYADFGRYVRFGPWKNGVEGHDCGAPIHLDTRYDREFCPGCDEWTERECCGGKCSWYPKSPERPSDAQ